jgi:hypothetical protein
VAGAPGTLATSIAVVRTPHAGTRDRRRLLPLQAAASRSSRRLRRQGASSCEPAPLLSGCRWMPGAPAAPRAIVSVYSANGGEPDAAIRCWCSRSQRCDATLSVCTFTLREQDAPPSPVVSGANFESAAGPGHRHGRCRRLRPGGGGCGAPSWSQVHYYRAYAGSARAKSPHYPKAGTEY